MNQGDAIKAIGAAQIRSGACVAIVVPDLAEAERQQATLCQSFPRTRILLPLEDTTDAWFELIIMMWSPDPERDGEVEWFCQGLYGHLVKPTDCRPGGQIKWLV